MKSLSRYKTDKEFETEGVWLDFGDFKIRVARAGGSNTKFLRAVTQAAKPYRRQIQADAFPVEQMTKIMIDVYSRTVVLDWTLLDEEDKPIECNYDNKVRIFEEYPDLFEQVQEYAQNYGNFLESLREDMVKN